MQLELSWEDLSRAEQMALTMSEAEWVAEQKRLTPSARLHRLYDWKFWRRPDQTTPTHRPWSFWLLNAGRGSGKTRTGAEQVREWAEEAARNKAPIQMALIAETKADVRDVLIQGPSGLLRISPPWHYPRYEPSNRHLIWPDGTLAILFSGDEPNQLRGPQFHKAWVDELAKYQYPEEAWDMLEFSLRLGDNPQAVITTTPRPIKKMRELLTDDPDVVVSTTSSYRNMANLSPKYIERVIRRYEGTRLGEQEIYARLLADTPGALWKLGLIEATRVAKVPELVRIVIGVDPAVTSHPGRGRSHRQEETNEDESNETGIVVCGLDARGHGYVWRDASGIHTPNEWALRVANLFVNHRADRIVAERNNGGDLVAYTMHTVAPNLPVKLVWASRGKFARAEPIAALYEQHRIHHVGVLSELEDEMTTWTPDVTEWSPDRMDAMVWAMTELFFEGGTPDDATAWPTVRS